MEDFDLDIVAKKSVKGIFALVSRTFLIQVLAIVANLILGAYLTLESFGVFFIVSSIVVFLNYFQDIGLAASLIQKKEEPTIDDFRTTFTIQQLLVVGLIAPMIIFSKQIASFYSLNQNGYLLFLALLISFFLSSLRTIPTVILERRLEFKKLVVPQIIENIFYFSALILFAVLNFGVKTFTIAVLARSVSGLIATYYIQPWSIGFSFKKDILKRLLSFGIPFQANSILALIKDDLLNLYMGKILPLSQVGFIGFSQKWAYLPLRLVMDNVIKIMFPSYSRLQHNKDALRLAIEKSLFLVSFFIFPAAIAIVLFSSSFIHYFPRYEKWREALIPLSFFASSTVFSSISTPLTNFLNAIGKVKITLAFMVFWTAATWIVTIFGIQMFGYNGVAIASFLVSLSSIAVIFVSRRYIKFSIILPIVRQLFAAVIMGIFIFVTRDIFVVNLATLVVEAIFAGAVYILVLFILGRDELISTLFFIVSTVRSKV